MIAPSRLVVLLSTSFIVCDACNSTPIAANSPAGVAAAVDTTPPAYFPPGAIDSFGAQWFGGQLRAMGEPPLFGATIPAGTTVFRFLWLRSFDPDLAVRVTESPELCTVTTTIIGMRVDSLSAPDSQRVQMLVSSRPGPTLRRDSTPVPLQECIDLHAQLIAAGLWSGPATDNVVGLDGDELLFEMVDGRGYSVARRWTPYQRHAPEFRKASYLFIALGKVNPTSSMGHQ